ncbi:MAG: TIGR03560 family F420-dependent LLM class oxidoreductase [Candidatus Dormibacteraeota bacterium]|nr:TIGR03560 family F420-dependent LLM class oxidoreductase [Candidatus Dormibacteraeota bacterium]
MTRPVSFGICTDQNMTWKLTQERWRMFEDLGFDSAWLCDHLVQPSRPTGPYFEAWTLLAGLAARTERIRLGVLVSSNTFRHPALLAKQAVTVDHLSGGRLEVGLGAGWYEPEHAAFGIPFPETKELVGRFREAVQVVDLLLRQELSSFEGRYYHLHEARSRPEPVQSPRPPLLLAGFGPRMLRIVAEHADTWNAFGRADEMRERNQLLDHYCTELGRDPNSLTRSLYGWAASGSDPWASVQAFHDWAGPYLEAGMNQLIIDQPGEDQLAVMERVAGDALPSLRAAGAPDRETRAARPDSETVWSRPADYV